MVQCPQGHSAQLEKFTRYIRKEIRIITRSIVLQRGYDRV